MMLFAIVGLMGIILGYILADGETTPKPSKFEENLMVQCAMGKRVVISVGDEAVIFEMVNGKMTITKGISTYNPEPIDVSESTIPILPVGVGRVSDLESDSASSVHH